MSDFAKLLDGINPSDLVAIDEFTDARRAAEYRAGVTDMNTSSGRLTQYGMACGYVYKIIANHTPDTWASLTMSLEGGEYSVDYFSNADGTRSKGFAAYIHKSEAERTYRKLATIVRKRGQLTDDEARAALHHYITHTA